MRRIYETYLRRRLQHTRILFVLRGELNLVAAFKELEHLYIPMIKQTFVRYFPFAPNEIFQTALVRLSRCDVKREIRPNIQNKFYKCLPVDFVCSDT